MARREEDKVETERHRHKQTRRGNHNGILNLNGGTRKMAVKRREGIVREYKVNGMKGGG